MPCIALHASQNVTRSLKYLKVIQRSAVVIACKRANSYYRIKAGRGDFCIKVPKLARTHKLASDIYIYLQLLASFLGSVLYMSKSLPAPFGHIGSGDETNRTVLIKPDRCNARFTAGLWI